MNFYIIVTDSQEAFLVYDTSKETAMKRILTHTVVANSIKLMSLPEAMKFTDFNILQIHDAEVTHLVL